MPPSIIILGATSQIACDFMVHAFKAYGTDFALFARRPEAADAFVAANGLPRAWITGALSDFPAVSKRIGEVAGIVNFVGIGDPAKAKEMGARIFDATLASDALARAFIAERPGAPYVFCSSGAVYGTGFAAPAGPDTPSVTPVNALEPQHFYTVSKLHAEAMHRASAGDTILDLRIFNYFSRTQDLGARFLITDMLRCVAEGRMFETTDSAMTRDYIHPADLCALMMALLGAPRGTNQPVDVYSAAPITKAELIDLFSREFGLKTRILPQLQTLDATGAKPEYYSLNRTAGTFGYRPTYSSAQCVLAEGRAMLEAARGC
jgi:nucleoside-diphosphate-sugar epimerase